VSSELSHVVNRLVRLLLSEEYQKKASKSELLPKVGNRDEAFAAIRVLQVPVFVLRVEKVSAHHGHDHAEPTKPKTTEKKKKKKDKKKSSTKPKSPQNLSVIRDQAPISETDYLAWFYNTTQLQTILGGIGIVIVVFGAILFPLWPLALRTGAWYLSVLMLSLIAAIFVIAVVRLILFVITMFAVPPGLWLFPNLFEDVGVLESFVPLWAWQKPPRQKRKGKESSGEGESIPSGKGKSIPSGEGKSIPSGEEKRSLHTTVEDVPEEE
jgi:translocation protein SEC62